MRVYLTMDLLFGALTNDKINQTLTLVHHCCMGHIFISYSRKNKGYARALADDIRKHGFDVWIDDSIDFGDRWWRMIVDAIENCSAVVVVMSNDAEKSEWVEREILLAQREEKPIYPVLLEGRGFALLITTQYADVTSGRMPGQDFYRRLSMATRPTKVMGVQVTPRRMPRKRGKDNSWLGLVAGGFVIGIAMLVVFLLFAFFQLSDEGASEEDLGQSFTPTSRPDASVSSPEVALAFDEVLQNGDWTPVEAEFDGVAMVLVPIGCFDMGTHNGTELDEQPVHEQCIQAPFWIDKYEVTNEQYGQQIASACERYTSEASEPRGCVSWFDARAFCEARGGRLPTELEWEYAARGPDNLIYPWGNEWNPENTVWLENASGRVENVGHIATDESWVGALDMMGNIAEWVSTLYADYPYNATDGREVVIGDNQPSLQPVWRGASFNTSMRHMRASTRGWSTSDYENRTIGFRCVRSIE